MSQENVERVKEMYEAFNCGDVERALKLLHPQPELHQPPEIVDAAVYVGLEAFLKGMSRFTEAWHDPRFEPLDAEQVGAGVLMRVRVSGRGRASGLDLSTELFHAWTLRDGRAFQCFVRSTREEVLKAAGLEG